MPAVGKFGPGAMRNRQASMLDAFGDLTRVIGMARGVDLSRSLPAKDENPGRL